MMEVHAVCGGMTEHAVAASLTWQDKSEALDLLVTAHEDNYTMLLCTVR